MHHSQRQSNAHAQDQVESVCFYIHSLEGLSGTAKTILELVADCLRRGKTFQPTQNALAALCSRSRSSVQRAIYDELEGSHGWLLNEERWGRRTNIYSPGWRLMRLIGRERKA